MDYARNTASRAFKLINQNNPNAEVDVSPVKSPTNGNAETFSASSKSIMESINNPSRKRMFEIENSEEGQMSLHSSSINEEELLSDIHTQFKNDEGLVKVAQQMNIGNLYKKYFNSESEQDTIKRQAIDFIHNAKNKNINMKNRSWFSADKIVRINKVTKIQMIKVENAKRLIKEQQLIRNSKSDQ